MRSSETLQRRAVLKIAGYGALVPVAAAAEEVKASAVDPLVATYARWQEVREQHDAAYKAVTDAEELLPQFARWSLPRVDKTLPFFANTKEFHAGNTIDAETLAELSAKELRWVESQSEVFGGDPVVTKNKARISENERLRLEWWKAEKQRIQAERERLGLPALDEAVDRLEKELGALEGALGEAQPVTVAGLFVKLRYLSYTAEIALDEDNSDLVAAIKGIQHDAERLLTTGGSEVLS